MQQTGQQYWQQLFTQFDQLRTGRLVAFLRRREPDAMVGYSILIYRLTDADLALALNGPPPRPPGLRTVNPNPNPNPNPNLNLKPKT